MINSTQNTDAYYNSSFQNKGSLLASAMTEDNPNRPSTNVALYFDTILSHSVQLNSNITDNWLENNSVVNDCIALPPLEVTLQGLSGELIYNPANFKNFISEFWSKTNAQLTEEYIKGQGTEYVIVDKLSPITSLYPPLDNVTQTALNIKNAVETNVNKYKTIYNSFKNNGNNTSPYVSPNGSASNLAVNTPYGIAPTRLQMVYENLSSLRVARTALTVITPYAIFENMYIQSLTFTQDNLNHITDISATLKQLTFSEVKTTKADAATLAKFNAAAKAEVENQGKVQGQNSTLYNVLTPNAEYVNAN